jgi:hypothetical protein
MIRKGTLVELAEMAARARIEYTQHVCSQNSYDGGFEEHGNSQTFSRINPSITLIMELSERLPLPCVE